MKGSPSKTRKIFSRLWFLPLLLIVFYLGYAFNGGEEPSRAIEDHSRDHGTAVKGGTAQDLSTQIWTCSMHPQIRLPKPGQCPICGMDLIPVTTGDQVDSGGPREITLSERARKLADIRTEPVRRQSAQSGMEIRLPGKVDYDETRFGYITAWVPGRIEKMYVNFTGTVVKKDEPMVDIYSPDLYTAQEELLQAKKAVKNLDNSSLESMKIMAVETVEAVREKLRLLGLTESQISDIETRKEPDETTTIYAPMSGVVIQKEVSEGMYVKTGTRIYTIADLSTVWIMLDAYESDLALIHLGQRVTFEAEAFPGRTFRGTVQFIHPTLDKETRTSKIHVIVPNRNGRLMPEMLVTAVVHSGIGKGSAPLVIPASAPLITGKRAVVYVADAGKEGTFEGREIVLGPRAGDYYIVREGLSEGEHVVTHGNFKIDSALQIMAKPSMMSPESGGPAPGHQHGGPPSPGPASSASPEVKRTNVPEAFQQALDGVFNAYFKMHHGLSRDNLEEARSGAEELLEAFKEQDMSLLKGETHMAWMKELKILKQNTRDIGKAKMLDPARKAFQHLSDSLIRVAKNFGTGKLQALYRYRCSMAFDNRGADWLQVKTGAENPYYGSSMPGCGEKTEDLIKEKGKGKSGRDGNHD